MWKTLALLIISYFQFASSISCLDHNSKPVDWFVGYKLPRLKHEHGLISKGAAYLYITSADNAWQISNISINSSDSILGLTLEVLYKNSNLLHILYNDQSPNGTVSYHKGHTKGVVLGDRNGGIWLVHSVPHFPSLSSKLYFYPHTGYEYGQSFLCISLDSQNLDKVGTQLKYNEPYIYSSSIPSPLINLYPILKDVINGAMVTSAPWNHIEILESISGLKFTSFAKSGNFGKDLYLDWVAPVLDSNLFVETWPHEPHRLPSDCSKPNKVYNVESLSMSFINISFGTANDHSKWAVGSNNQMKWICIGDINRAVPQEHRGGGTVCFNNLIATAYQDIIHHIQDCNHF